MFSVMFFRVLFVWFTFLPLVAEAVNLGCSDEQESAQRHRIAEFLSNGGARCETSGDCTKYAFVPFCDVAVAKTGVEQLKELYVTPKQCQFKFNHCLYVESVSVCKANRCQLEIKSPIHKAAAADRTKGQPLSAGASLN